VTLLHYTYGPTGRERIEYTCHHGATLLRGAELYLTPDGFAATIVRHRSRFGCMCEPDEFVRRWPDARLALAKYEAMAVDVPPDVDSLDLDILLRDLVDLRANAVCEGCVLSWTQTAEPGRIFRQYTHDPACPVHAERTRDGAPTGTRSVTTLRRAERAS
jgi:hypothetical protein